ncbi:mortality factor 4-like protein 1 [Trichosurus vulpecula]|uniref:mortality factor 4-like protein 1 n=1 Tax=Trichosurus vulpecula TaxID=9337 RepID=UPI00186ACE76|nr:mortality factor 4-like protein 1 [Trichosurus vulpecula]
MELDPKPDLHNAEAKLRIPEELKPWLMDDWDMVVKQNQLFHLPARKNVDSVLVDYENCERISQNASDEWMRQIKEAVIGIRAYFEVMLGSQLLYKFERPQYAEIIEKYPDVSMSQIYGAPHLLRLFVKSEQMINSTALDEQGLALLLEHLHRFLDYLANNVSVLFNYKEYDFASPEYYRRAFC